MDEGNIERTGRLRYFGKGDFGTFLQGERTCLLLREFDARKINPTATEVVEFYNLERLVADDIFPSALDEEEVEKFRDLLPEITKSIAVFFNAINEKTLVHVISDVDYGYHADLISLFGRFKVYNRCEPETLFATLDSIDVNLHTMLTDKELVRYGNAELRSRMIGDSHGAERVIQKRLAADSSESIYLPSSLTKEDVHLLLNSYIDDELANLNYIELISTAPVNGASGIDGKTKLKAKRVYESRVAEFLSGKGVLRSGYEVSISDDQSDAVSVEENGHDIRISYSRQWLKNSLDPASILNNFLHLFGFADEGMILTLPSYPSQLGTLEGLIGVPAKSAYRLGAAFRASEQISLMNTAVAYRFSKIHGNDLASVFEWFFSDYLSQEFGAQGFRFRAPSSATTSLENCRHVFVEIESVLKQFSLYVADAEIDWGLMSIASDQIEYKRVPSMIDGKYVYGVIDSDLAVAIHYLFSDQSGLTYINKSMRAESAARLLIDNHVSYTDFLDYQKPLVDHLVGLGFLEISPRLRFASAAQYVLLRGLYERGVVSYWHYQGEARNILDDWESREWIVRRSSLLSDPEGSYFNYCLNQSEFSNGPDLRNKYLHGSVEDPDDERHHFEVYLVALKLLAALTIKINDEFCIRDQNGDAFNQGDG